MEEALSLDRAANKVPTKQLNARIVELARYAERLNPNGILHTCSAFGEGIEEASRTSNLPVLKPNEAMFGAAFSYGDNIAMIYTFPPSVSGMEREFQEAAELNGSKATLRSIFAEGALDALKRGDALTHNKIIANVAQGINKVDAVLLAQFSTAQAAPTRHCNVVAKSPNSVFDFLCYNNSGTAEYTNLIEIIKSAICTAR